MVFHLFADTVMQLSHLNISILAQKKRTKQIIDHPDKIIR